VNIGRPTNAPCPPFRSRRAPSPSADVVRFGRPRDGARRGSAGPRNPVSERRSIGSPLRRGQVPHQQGAIAPRRTRARDEWRRVPPAPTIAPTVRATKDACRCSQPEVSTSTRSTPSEGRGASSVALAHDVTRHPRTRLAGQEPMPQLVGTCGGTCTFDDRRLGAHIGSTRPYHCPIIEAAKSDCPACARRRRYGPFTSACSASSTIAAP
jgi:hypothetical protein